MWTFHCQHEVCITPKPSIVLHHWVRTQTFVEFIIILTHILLISSVGNILVLSPCITGMANEKEFFTKHLFWELQHVGIRWKYKNACTHMLTTVSGFFINFTANWQDSLFLIRTGVGFLSRANEMRLVQSLQLVDWRTTCPQLTRCSVNK